MAPWLCVYRTLFYFYVLLQPWISLRLNPPHGEAPGNALRIHSHLRPYLWHPHNDFCRRVLASSCNEPTLRVLVLLLQASLACCAAGVALWLSAPAAAAAYFFLQGMNSGLGKLGQNHECYMIMYTLAALALWPCDHCPTLASAALDWPLPPVSSEVPGSLSPGFALKLIKVCAFYTIFAGGVSKLVNGGRRYLDGATLRFHASDPRYGNAKPFKRWLCRHPSVASALVKAGVAYECAMVVPMLCNWRLPEFVAATVGFHVFILAVMVPNYLPQCACYVWILGLEGQPMWEGSSAAECAALAGVIGVLFLVILRRYEGFPLTHIPMYSHPMHGYDAKALKSRAQLEALARVSQVARYGKLIYSEDLLSSRWLVIRDAHGRELTEKYHERVCRKNAFQQRAFFLIFDYVLHADVEGASGAAEKRRALAQFVREVKRDLVECDAIDEAMGVHVFLVMSSGPVSITEL